MTRRYLEGDRLDPTALLFQHYQRHEGQPILEGHKIAVRTDVMYTLEPSVSGRRSEP